MPCTLPHFSHAPAATSDTATAGTVRFVDNACANLDALLPQEIVGQELALAQLTDALCHHLSQPRPKKPLVISVHGPPGVGKTYTHLWLARILYSKQPSAALQCPGMHCKGYKVRGWEGGAGGGRQQG
jgi:Cdc6-like AAA superfamily ATPase